MPRSDVPNDYRACRCRANRREPHPLRFFLQSGKKFARVLGTRDLTNRTIDPSEIDSEEVADDSGYR